MAKHVTIAVHVEIIDVTPGLWCRECMLPSGCRITAAIHIGPVLRLATEQRCDDCHGRNVEAHR